MLVFGLPVISLATDYAALEKELKTARGGSQSNLSGGDSAMQEGFGQQKKQQNIDRSIYDQNRGVSQRQQGYSRDQGNNISKTEFMGQQKEQDMARSIYNQNRDIS